MPARTQRIYCKEYGLISIVQGVKFVCTPLEEMISYSRHVSTEALISKGSGYNNGIAGTSPEKKSVQVISKKIHNALHDISFYSKNLLQNHILHSLFLSVFILIYNMQY